MSRFKPCLWLVSPLMVVMLGIGCAAKVEEPPVNLAPEDASESLSPTPVFKDGFESGKTEGWADEPNEEEKQTEEEGEGG